MLIDANSQQRGALFKSVTLTGTSGNSCWETSSYELLKDKLLVETPDLDLCRCLRGAPLWAYRIRRVFFLFFFFVSWEIPLQLFMVQSTATRTDLSVDLEGTVSTQIYVSPLSDSWVTTLSFSPSAVIRQTSDHLHRSHVYVCVLLRNPGI